MQRLAIIPEDFGDYGFLPAGRDHITPYPSGDVVLFLYSLILWIKENLVLFILCHHV
jgi:hypothetical protein